MKIIQILYLLGMGALLLVAVIFANQNERLNAENAVLKADQILILDQLDSCNYGFLREIQLHCDSICPCEVIDN